jgi:hypothetical protein
MKINILVRKPDETTAEWNANTKLSYVTWFGDLDQQVGTHLRSGADRFCSFGYVGTFQNTQFTEKSLYINDIFNTDR